MAKINKQVVIDNILSEIEKGSTYSDCLRLIATSCDLHKATFTRYWKEANKTYLERRQSIEKELTGERLEAEKERLKSNILTKTQRMQLATDIALNEESSNNDKLKALDYLSKIEGDYAPVQTESEVSIVWNEERTYEK